MFLVIRILILMVSEGGLVLSSHFVRCRDADSLTFGSVRLFKSLKTCTQGMFYNSDINFNGVGRGT